LLLPSERFAPVVDEVVATMQRMLVVCLAATAISAAATPALAGPKTRTASNRLAFSFGSAGFLGAIVLMAPQSASRAIHLQGFQVEIGDSIWQDVLVRHS